MQKLLQRLRTKFAPPPRQPPEHLPLPDSIPGHTARWLADWCEGSPERMEVVVNLGGAPLMGWLLDLTCSGAGAHASSLPAHSTEASHAEWEEDGGQVAASRWDDDVQEQEGGEGDDVWDASMLEAMHAERALASLLLSGGDVRLHAGLRNACMAHTSCCVPAGYHTLDGALRQIFTHCIHA